MVFITSLRNPLPILFKAPLQKCSYFHYGGLKTTNRKKEKEKKKVKMSKGRSGEYNCILVGGGGVLNVFAFELTKKKSFVTESRYIP